MIKLKRFDWDKGQDVEYRANEKEVEKLVNFFLNSKAWHDDIEIVHKKVRAFRARSEYVKPEETRQGAQLRA
jgi:hypothetical protein